jgi:predicted amidohydrolase YtcJ
MSLDGSTSGDGIAVAGFADHHTHLLRTAARQPWPWQGGTVREFHERVWRDGSTPMDIGARMLAGTDYPIEVLDPLVGLARLVSGRSERPGFGTQETAPQGSRLTIDQAIRLSCDATAGLTLLSADPATAAPGELDHIRVLGTAPAPF